VIDFYKAMGNDGETVTEKLKETSLGKLSKIFVNKLLNFEQWQKV
jgi:hypothetical protein